MTWDLQELRNYYVATHPLGSNLTLTLISSLSRLTEIFGYHLRLARDAADGFFDPEKPEAVDTLLLLFGQSARQEDFAKAKVISEANILGIVHAARGLLDIFSQLVNELILSPKMAVAKVDVDVVTKKLPRCRLKDEMDRVLASSSYQYVNAFVNTIKHRQLVPHVIHVSHDMSGLRLESFVYRNVVQPAYSVREALQVVLDVANTLITLGPLLNDQYIRGKP